MFFKKKINKKNKIILYNNCYKNSVINLIELHHLTSYFGLFMRKKLQFFKYYYKKYYSLSNGITSKLKDRKLALHKFFKKTSKSIPHTIVFFEKVFLNFFRHLTIFECKNYNFRNHTWIKKFTNLLQPNIKYFIVGKSFNYSTKKKRRLKKIVFRNIWEVQNFK